MLIRQLSAETVNRIAAGEVIERPASAVKELVENAVDAGATRIEIVTATGGLSLIRVTDDGAGMGADDLALSVERHATSKLSEEDLFDIRSLGFRGEALPSIGSIARLEVRSKRQDAREGLGVVVERGAKSAVRPAALNAGTIVEVRDLFSATPARLKFMKSERAENRAIAETVRRLAMAHPQIGFVLQTGERAALNLARGEATPESLLTRLGDIMGKEFMTDALEVARAGDGASGLNRVYGFAGLPTLHRNDASQQYLFVNGRPVKDRLLIGAVKAAYGDLIPKGRSPYLALFLEVTPGDVDVNVHPSKAEVRFRDGGRVRALLVGAIGEALAKAGHRASAQGGVLTVESFQGHASPSPSWGRPGTSPPPSWNPPPPRGEGLGVGGIPERAVGGDPNTNSWESPLPASPTRGEVKGHGDSRRGEERRGRGSRKTTRRRSRRLRTRARMRALQRCRYGKTCSSGLWARRGRRCTRITSWRRRATGWSSSISTRRTNASSTSA